MKFDDLLKDFLRSRERGTGTARRQARQETINNYSSDLSYFFQFMSAADRNYIEFSQIRRADLDDFIDWVQKKSGWAPASQYKMLRSVRALFRWMERDDDYRDLKQLRKYLPIIPATPAKINVPEFSDIKKTAACFNLKTRSGLRDYTMFMLMVDTGIRAGEIRHLKLNKLFLSQGLIMAPVEGKTGERPLWISPDTADDLKRWLNLRSRFANNEYVFVTDEGNPLTKFIISDIFRYARQRSGTKGVTAHSVRHYFCTNWILKGGSLAQLMQMTGHKNLSTLQIYIHIANSQSVGREQMKVNPRQGIKPDWRTGRERKKVG